MLEKAILESTIFYNFSRIFQQFSTATSVDLNNTTENKNTHTTALIEDIKKEGPIAKEIMSTTLKFKAIFYSIFQSPNPMLIQKSMRHVDSFADTNDTNDYRIKREKNNESVRKSRAKNRVKLQECSSSVQDLNRENVQLNKKLDGLQSELYTLKGLFQHCFSFKLDNLSIKPSEIPTSTLHKIIMQNKGLGTSSTQQNYIEKPIESTSKTTLPMNDIDNHYVNQIKKALSNIVSPSANINPVSK